MAKAPLTFNVREETEDFKQVSEDVYDLLDHLIDKHRSLSFLIHHLPIKILFRLKPSYKRGQKVLGNTSVVSGKDKLLHPYNATIILDLEYWDAHPDKREPLLFHELCHLDDDDGKLSLVDHDFSEFYAVIRHYGDWQNKITHAKNQLQDFQLDLFKDVPEFSLQTSET